MDLSSRQVVGWSMNNRITKKLVASSTLSHCRLTT
jgi:hypothetical protein